MEVQLSYFKKMLACCGSWHSKDCDPTEWLNWTELNWTELNWTEWPSGFSYFFHLSLNLAIRSSWSEPQSDTSLIFAECIELSIFGCKKYYQSDFGVDHLVMSICRVFSFVVGRGCLLWPVFSISKTLLAFALLHSVLQGQICLLLQVFPDFLLLYSSPL